MCHRICFGKIVFIFLTSCLLFDIHKNCIFNYTITITLIHYIFILTLRLWKPRNTLVRRSIAATITFVLLIGKRFH